MRATTICCSVAALTFAASLAFTAEQRPAVLSIIPVRTVWNLPLNNPLSVPPAFGGSRAYFPLSGNRLAAYDLVSGKQLWLREAHVDSQPAVGGGLVYIVEPGAIVALGENDGEVRWKYAFDEPLASRLVWDNEWLIAAGRSGEILAFRASDGQVIWRRDIGSPVHAAPLLSADRVYLPLENNHLLALLISNGMPVWDRLLGGPPNDILAFEDRLYVGAVDKYLYCVEAETGQIQWRYPTGLNVTGAPVADERRVYFVSLDNFLRALDRKSGSQVWKRALPLRPTAGPRKAADVVLITGLSPTVRAYRLTDGNPAGEIAAPGEMAAPPYLVDIAGLPAPLVVLVSRTIATGAAATAFTRAFDPPTGPIGPLPNPIPVALPAESTATAR